MPLEVVLGLVVIGLGFASLVVATLAWRFPRTTTTEPTFSRLDKLRPYGSWDSPTVHSKSGVPTLQQLTGDIEMEPKVAAVAQILYEVGLEQYKRPVNNRDGIIQDSRREMGKLRSCLKTTEVELAERIGVLLATSAHNVEQRRITQTEYDQLPPLAQTYAQHKRREHETQRTIARDLEKDVSRTDYTA